MDFVILYESDSKQTVLYGIPYEYSRFFSWLKNISEIFRILNKEADSAYCIVKIVEITKLDNHEYEVVTSRSGKIFYESLIELAPFFDYDDLLEAFETDTRILRKIPETEFRDDKFIPNDKYLPPDLDQLIPKEKEHKDYIIDFETGELIIIDDPDLDPYLKDEHYLFYIGIIKPYYIDFIEDKLQHGDSLTSRFYKNKLKTLLLIRTEPIDKKPVLKLELKSKTWI